ncbi:hypothetical protein D3C84_1295620 [compost metagenome]
MGGVGNRVMGRAVVANAKEAFGPMPLVIPGELGGPPQAGGQVPGQGSDAKASDTNAKNNPAQEGGTFWI